MYGAALELVNRANAEHRQLTPAEHGHCQRLIATLDGLDARLRRAGTDARGASDTEPNMWDWARANDASYGAACLRARVKISPVYSGVSRPGRAPP